MAQCSFCSGKIPGGRGKMHVKADGRVFWYCNSKCEKNAGLGRAGKKTRWTRTFRKERA
jgi:large subunit ribosomal protein L24e